jgi:hypothetical protein
MHFLTEEFLAAPESFLPSALIALASQHFFMEDVLAAPASGLPSLPTAFASQLMSWAKAVPPANATTRPASIIFLNMVFPRGYVERQPI